MCVRSIDLATVEPVHHDQRNIVFSTLSSHEVLDRSQH
jgi:hypothetical protein